MAACPRCGKKPELETDARMACGDDTCPHYDVWFPRAVWEADDLIIAAGDYITHLSERLAGAEGEIKRLERIVNEVERLPDYVFWIEKKRGEFLEEMQDRYMETGENRYDEVAETVGYELAHFKMLKRELRKIIDTFTEG